MAETPSLVKQADWRPTRKLFISAVSGFVTVGVQATIVKIAAGNHWLDWLSNDVATAAVPIMVGFGVGYMMRERAAAQPAPPSQP